MRARVPFCPTPANEDRPKHPDLNAQPEGSAGVRNPQSVETANSEGHENKSHRSLEVSAKPGLHAGQNQGIQTYPDQGFRNSEELAKRIRCPGPRYGQKV